MKAAPVSPLLLGTRTTDVTDAIADDWLAAANRNSIARTNLSAAYARVLYSNNLEATDILNDGTGQLRVINLENGNLVDSFTTIIGLGDKLK